MHPRVIHEVTLLLGLGSASLPKFIVLESRAGGTATFQLLHFTILCGCLSAVVCVY